MSVTLKISFPVAEPRGQGRLAVSTRLAYTENGTTEEIAANMEICGLWHVSYPVPKLRWTKMEVSTGCSGLCGEQLPAQSPQGLCVAMLWCPLGGLEVDLCSRNGLQGQDTCIRSTKSIQ